MNRLPLFSVLFLIFTILGHITYAQLSVGARTGLSVSTFRSPPDRVQIDHITGFEVAIPVEYRINERVSLQSELNYTRKGVEFSRPSPVNVPVGTGLLKSKEGVISLDYLQVPFLFKFTPEFDHWSFSTFAGPYIGFSLGGNIDQSFGSLSEDNQHEQKELSARVSGGDIEAIDMGLTLGAAFHYIPATRKITLRRRPSFVFDVRYHFGLTDVDAQRLNGAVKNRTLVLSIGYMIPVGRR